jgi:DNA-binding GntR family transcriptional regulator
MKIFSKSLAGARPWSKNRAMNEIALNTAPPSGPESLPAFEASGVYELIREDIVEGRLAANERLKISELAARFGTSTNPVREALQQLRGEGFVVFSPNRGARVRAVDEEFVRDICEVEMLIEPYLTRWFAGLATDADVERLENIQAEIEKLNFADLAAHSTLDTNFHRVLYDRHYNRHVIEMWWRHREILRAISRRFPVSRGRRAAVLREHRQLIDCLKAQDVDGAAKVIAAHVEGSGRHMIEQMRAARNNVAARKSHESFGS